MTKEGKWSHEMGLIRATIAGALIGFSWKPDPKMINSLTDKMVEIIKGDIKKIVRKEIKLHDKRRK